MAGGAVQRAAAAAAAGLDSQQGAAPSPRRRLVISARASADADGRPRLPSPAKQLFAIFDAEQQRRSEAQSAEYGVLHNVYSVPAWRNPRGGRSLVLTARYVKPYKQPRRSAANGGAECAVLVEQKAPST